MQEKASKVFWIVWIAAFHVDRPDGIFFILTEFHQLSVYCLVTDVSTSSVDVWSVLTFLSTAVGGPSSERVLSHVRIYYTDGYIFKIKFSI